MKYIRTYFIWIALIMSACKSQEDPQAKELNNAGVEFMEQQNYSSALIKFQEALPLHQSDENKSKIYRNMSTVYFNMGKADSSRFYARKAYEVVPEGSYLSLVNKAEFNLMDNEIPEAIRLLEQAVAKYKNGVEGLSNLSLIYSGNFDEQYIDLKKALELAKKAYKILPSATNEEQIAAIYHQMHDYSHAIKLYSKLMKAYPENKLYQFNAGLSLYESGQIDEGLHWMEEAAARDEYCRELLNELLSENIE